jgi:hypothetical protein
VKIHPRPAWSLRFYADFDIKIIDYLQKRLSEGRYSVPGTVTMGKSQHFLYWNLKRIYIKKSRGFYLTRITYYITIRQCFFQSLVKQNFDFIFSGQIRIGGNIIHLKTDESIILIWYICKFIEVKIIMSPTGLFLQKYYNDLIWNRVFF